LQVAIPLGELKFKKMEATFITIYAHEPPGDFKGVYHREV
jgi:hypothetical protein